MVGLILENLFDLSFTDSNYDFSAVSPLGYCNCPTSTTIGPTSAGPTGPTGPPTSAAGPANPANTASSTNPTEPPTSPTGQASPATATANPANPVSLTGQTTGSTSSPTTTMYVPPNTLTEAFFQPVADASIFNNSLFFTANCASNQSDNHFCVLAEDGQLWSAPSNLSAQFNFLPGCADNSSRESCHVYMSMSSLDGSAISLTSKNGGQWSSPTMETPIGPESGYLLTLAASCRNCDNIRHSEGQCTGAFW